MKISELNTEAGFLRITEISRKRIERSQTIKQGSQNTGSQSNDGWSLEESITNFENLDVEFERNPEEIMRAVTSYQ